MSIQYNEAIQLIIEELQESLGSVKQEEVEDLIREIKGARKIYFIGVGRVLLSLEGIAKRWAHLGYDTHIVGEITEPAITADDILIVGSGSGNSLIPVAIAKKAHSIGAKVIHIGSNRNSAIKDITDLMVRIPVVTKEYLPDEVQSQQPMTTLFDQSLLLFGDAISLMLIREEGFDMKSLWEFHANLE